MVISHNRRFVIFASAISFAMAISLIHVTFLSAQPSSSRGPGKSLLQDQANSSSKNSSTQFDATITNMIDSSTDTQLYDPQTLWALQGLKEVAQPPWDPFDMEEIETRRAVSKAFMIQSARHGSFMINHSELKPTFRALKQEVRAISDIFRYSIQADDDFFSISREKKGNKILELNLEFNTSQGLDPQIRIFDAVRFRYDIIEKRHLFEYGLNF